MIKMQMQLLLFWFIAICAILHSDVEAQYPACYLCGALDCTLANPEKVIWGEGPFVTCQQILDAGPKGLVPPDTCAQVSALADVAALDQFQPMLIGPLQHQHQTRSVMHHRRIRNQQ
jgi:hypothetical protein